MNKFFDIERHKNKVALIDEFKGQLTYADLLKIGSQLYPDKKKSYFKNLIFILCKNNFETITGYITFLKKKFTVLLLSANISHKNLKKLILIYKPNYVYGEKEKVKLLKKKVTKTIGSYALTSFRFKTNTKLNSNLSILLQTSGTTGSPQLVRHSYKNIIFSSNAISNYLKIKTNDRVITTLPMNYTYGLSIINSHLLKGSSIILTDHSILTRNFWEIFEKHKATTFGGVPYTFEILDKLKFEKMKLTNLRYVTQAGGKLNDHLIKKFNNIGKKNSFKFFVMYGQTEATSRMSYLNPKYNLTKLGSIGKPIRGGAFLLVNEKGKKINRPGVKGELIYKGKNVCMGYAEKRKDLAKGDDKFSVLKTGDLATFDKDRFYYIAGRKKRFIKFFGHRVNLEDIEKTIHKYNFQCVCSGNENKINFYIKTKNISLENKIKDIIKNEFSFIRDNFKIILIDDFKRNEIGKIIYHKYH